MNGINDQYIHMHVALYFIYECNTKTSNKMQIISLSGHCYECMKTEAKNEHKKEIKMQRTE